MGAGASADFGVPTLRGIFKDIRAVQHLTDDNWLLKHLREIFWHPRGFDWETSERSLTIEEMLTILRDWELETAVTPKLSADELRRFRKSLYVLIFRALFVGKSTRAEHLNQLIKFANNNFNHTTWASFNWDCIFESSYWYTRGGNPTLGVNIANWRNGSTSHLLLKLHGSLNWWMINNVLTYLRFSGSGNLRGQWSKFMGETSPTDCPVILEPSYYKYEDDVYKIVEPQWRMFLERLVQADYVLIIGYSLPSADSQARSKLLTAFQANTKARWGIIDPNPEICSTYGRLFGITRLKTFVGSLVGFNNAFADNFKALFKP